MLLEVKFGERSLEEFSTKWFKFTAKGHENIKALHETTFEITKDDYLTPRGDCIIGIRSEASASDLPEWLKQGIRSEGLILVIICSEGICDSIVGYGSHEMQLNDPRKMVFRKSDYIGPETVMIRASKAARDIKRELIERLKRGSRLEVFITVLNRDLWFKKKL